MVGAIAHRRSRRRRRATAATGTSRGREVGALDCVRRPHRGSPQGERLDSSHAGSLADAGALDCARRLQRGLLESERSPRSTARYGGNGGVGVTVRRRTNRQRHARLHATAATRTAREQEVVALDCVRRPQRGSPEDERSEPSHAGALVGAGALDCT